MSIGIFDSGLGGLTVAKAVMQAMPEQKIIYFGDTARSPYGNKSVDDITKFAIENTEFLLKKKAKAIVVGCNSASAVAGQRVLRRFPNVLVFEVITPAVREALRVTRNGKIGVIGTRATTNSNAYQKWIKNIHAVACPLFVPLVEGGEHGGLVAEELAKHYLRDLKNIDTLILGCTHYPFLKETIMNSTKGRVQLVDSAETIAKDLQFSLAYLKKVKNPKHEFYVSKKTPHFQDMAEKWLGKKVNLKVSKV